jgi:hypothetical protein
MKTPIARDTSISTLDSGTSETDTKLDRILRGVEILLDEEVTADDVE